MDGPVGQHLEDDHHRIDDAFEAFAQSLDGPVVDRTSFDTAAQALRHHIYVEEELHFPALKSGGLLAPVLVMLREHGMIWDLLDAITRALDDADPETVRATWPQLATVLAQHNSKEEQILYPAGDQHLAPNEADQVLSTLRAGTTPPGWVCEMATSRTRSRQHR